jgi:hypothetical protein
MDQLLCGSDHMNDLEEIWDIQRKIDKISTYSVTYGCFDEHIKNGTFEDKDCKMYTGIDVSFAITLSACFDSYNSDDCKKLYDTLPNWIKFYLERLNLEERECWKLKLKQCLVNLIERFSQGHHIAYVMSKKFGIGQTCGGLFFCFGERYVLLRIIELLYKEGYVSDDDKYCACFKFEELVSENDLRFLTDDNILFMSKQRLQLMMLGNMFPCDWFLKF